LGKEHGAGYTRGIVGGVFSSFGEGAPACLGRWRERSRKGGRMVGARTIKHPGRGFFDPTALSGRFSKQPDATGSSEIGGKRLVLTDGPPAFPFEARGAQGFAGQAALVSRAEENAPKARSGFTEERMPPNQTNKKKFMR